MLTGSELGVAIILGLVVTLGIAFAVYPNVARALEMRRRNRRR